MKINLADKLKVKIRLKLVQHNAHNRYITYENILELVSEIESKLQHILAKKDWKGLSFICDFNAQRFPYARKNVPLSTVVTIMRGANDWFITNIQHWECHKPNDRIRPENLHLKRYEIIHFTCNSKNWN